MDWADPPRGEKNKSTKAREKRNKIPDDFEMLGLGTAELADLC